MSLALITVAGLVQKGKSGSQGLLKRSAIDFKNNVLGKDRGRKLYKKYRNDR
jgi:hypothetical protein